MMHVIQGAYYVKNFSKHGPLHNPYAYGYYEHVPRIWGLSVIDDQNVGGALMLVEQSIVLLTALVILFVRMLAQSEEEERRRERLEDAAPA